MPVEKPPVIERTYFAKPLFYVGAPLLFLGAFLGALTYASNQQDRIDCLTWAHEAQTMPGFYLTQNQKAQCDYWHIVVYAPVR